MHNQHCCQNNRSPNTQFLRAQFLWQHMHRKVNSTINHTLTSPFTLPHCRLGVGTGSWGTGGLALAELC